MKTANAVKTLLNAIEYLETGNFPVSFAKLQAIRILNECAVKSLAYRIYMHHGLRIDRDSNGYLGLFPESNYHVTQDERLIRLHHD